MSVKEKESKTLQAKQAIRSFVSDGQFAVSKETLPRALAVKVNADLVLEQHTQNALQNWRDLFSGDEKLLQSNVAEEEVELHRMSQQVAQAWKKFQKNLPSMEQSADISNRPPSLQFLQSVVESAQERLDAKYRDSGVKPRLRRLCKLFSNYESLLKPIPTSDKYISLVAGSIGTLVKASVTHGEVAEGISTGLLEISEDVDFWWRKTERHSHHPLIHSYVRRLYVIIFGCFADIFTEWQKSSWTRFTRSFNKNALEDIVGKRRGQMKELEHKLGREIIHIDSEKTSDFQEAAMAFFTDMEYRLQGLEKYQMQTRMDQMLLATGSLEQRALEDSYSRISLEQRERGIISVSRSEANPTSYGLSNRSVENGPRELSTQEVFGEAASHIKRLNRDNMSQMPMYSVNDLHLERDVVEALKKWVLSSTSSFLWIEGPSDAEAPSKNSLTAASLIAGAQESNTPWVGYFIQPMIKGSGSKRRVLGTEVLVSLVYTLISQLLPQLPPQVPSSSFGSADVWKAEFYALDGAEASLPSAIAMIRKILDLFSGPVLCIIDGLEYLDYGSTKVANRSLLSSFIRSLSPGFGKGGSELWLKTCFTSDGYAELLAKICNKEGFPRVTYEKDEGDSSDEDISGIEERSLDEAMEEA
ncbi:MAG: hypothetical protein M1820_001640 [Bogoriella megaspora]|nr:MAG: hypothetical protein M1820_001640 [Bogoriella megaspora]